MPLVRDGRLVAVAYASQSDLMKPVLYGVLWDPGGRSIALINDAEVQVGDQIANYRVQEIRENSVVLKNGGESVVLTISFTPSAPISSP